MITEIPAALRICDTCGEMATGEGCETCAEIVRMATETARLCVDMGWKTCSFVVDDPPTKAQIYYRLVFLMQFRAHRLGKICEEAPRTSSLGTEYIQRARSLRPMLLGWTFAGLGLLCICWSLGWIGHGGAH